MAPGSVRAGVCSEQHGARGMDIKNSKLQDSDISKIRALLGVRKQRDIADQFGVSQATISRVATETCWKHI